MGWNRLKESAFCRSGFFQEWWRQPAGRQGKALWWSSCLHQCVSLSCNFTSPVLIQYEYLTCYLIITDSVLMVFTPLPNFSFQEVVQGDLKRSGWTLTLWLNFLGSSMTIPGFQLLDALKGRVITWGWIPSSRSGNGRVQQTLSQDDVLGLGHPISWGEVQTEVRAVGALVWGSDSSDMGTCMGAWQPPLVPLGLSLVETFLVYAQAPGRKSQAYKFAQ